MNPHEIKNIKPIYPVLEPMIEPLNLTEKEIRQIKRKDSILQKFQFEGPKFKMWITKKDCVVIVPFIKGPTQKIEPELRLIKKGSLVCNYQVSITIKR